MTRAPLDWTSLLLTQLTWHWDAQLRPRLEGLTDEEYHWRPAADSWSLVREGEGDAPMAVGAGEWKLEFGIPEPEPAPVTTIAWRLNHLLVGVFGERSASHFGGPPVTYRTYDYPGTAADALARLDEAQAFWRDGVAGLDDAALAAPCGEDGFEQDPMAALVLHIHREVIHHGAEIALLRDLYLRRG
ncbi:DinB family protein [Litorihabitans aurantiacus]|uniref:DinB-like domain-containing protein n=1 Tax=Litorihabitans aurantiacus TaxID=1930061 RepID=A0AA37XF68_9MICO|nr:DinB family protein [Litorihabitans aurantiacus]GMA32116.1 hypothetical protein GCM10025875_21080 [Litorihabitans aurantiacus]